MCNGCALRCIEEGDRIHWEPLSGRNGFVDAECRKGRTNQFAQTDRSVFLPLDGLRKRLPFAAMPLILAPARMNGFFTAVPNQVETAKIIEHCGATSPEHFDPLLREGPVTVGKITDRSFGAIG